MSKFAIFTIAGDEFGLELDKIFEIIKPQKITHLPNTPRFINGVINLRGTVIPQMDMRKRLNAEPSHQEERILIVKMHEETVGLLVDSVKEIVNIAEKEIASPPFIFKGLKTEYLNGIGKIGNRLIIILNLDSLLTSEEIMLLGNLQSTVSSDESLTDNKEDAEIG
ncbi:MAG: purine-binding chemotaxis protein CheW [Nitrospirae bacterium]|nr:purine-binding chemotaxis protein CheW [Nitrospirota bacterium]